MKTVLPWLLGVPLLAAAVQPSPLRFDSTVYDFGTTNTPPSLTGTFTFQNAGKTSVTLRRPVTSCGCAVASVTPERLQPGERGSLVFTINLAGMSRGPIQKQIYIQADDPGQTGVTLIAKANLVPLYDTDPVQLNLGEIRMGTVTNVTARLWRTDGKPLDVVRAGASQPNIVAHLEPLPHSNAAARVHVELKADGNPRWFYERVDFYTATATQAVVSLPIYARFVGDVVLNREEIYWAIVNRALPGTRSFRVKSSNPSLALSITNLTCTVPEVRMKVSPLLGESGYEVTLELERLPKKTTPVTDSTTGRPLSAQTVRGEISFETNVPSQPKVTLPITINLLKF